MPPATRAYDWVVIRPFMGRGTIARDLQGLPASCPVFVPPSPISGAIEVLEALRLRSAAGVQARGVNLLRDRHGQEGKDTQEAKAAQERRQEEVEVRGGSEPTATDLGKTVITH